MTGRTQHALHNGRYDYLPASGDKNTTALDNQLRTRVISPAQPQQPDYFRRTFNQQSHIALDNQLQNNVFAQLQLGYLDDTALDNQLQTRAIPLAQSQLDSIVMPLTSASAEYHNTSATWLYKTWKISVVNWISYIGCQLHKKKVFSSPFRKKRYNDFALVQEGRFSRLGPLLFADSGPSEEFVWLARGKNYGFFA
jgi:hypothetical protein